MHTPEEIAIKRFADVASHVCAILEVPAQPPRTALPRFASH